MAAWLLACCALVFAMVVVGGITRLTHSGLSIVEWQPLVGAVPPLDDAEWQETFAKVPRDAGIPPAQPRHDARGLQAHLLVGVFPPPAGAPGRRGVFVPFAWFLARRAIGRALAWKLGGIFALGALQGAVGWYMVASGLVDDPRVSSVRLAMHLGLALAIYAAMLWLALGLLAPERPRAARGLTRHAAALAALVYAMVLTGALVAGIHAGLAYNTWPLMDGHWVPPEILSIEPWWKNFVYNMATVQFDHRTLALVIALVAAVLWWRVRRDPSADGRARGWAHALAAAVALQLAAGISTLLLRVPLPLAALHQAGAVIVFTCALGVLRALVPPRALHT